MGHPLGCTLRKAFPVDFHHMSNVATSRDVVEACFMERAPFLAVRSGVTPTGPPAPALLPAAVTGLGSMARGFSGVHLLALLFAAADATPGGACTPWAGPCHSC
jgi:hypothetical protein